MDSNVLLNLWNGKIHPHENLAPKTPEYKALCDQINEARKNLENVLTNEGKDFFTKYEETSDLISEALHAEAFCVGFRLAARLFLEAQNDGNDLSAVKKILGIE